MDAIDIQFYCAPKLRITDLVQNPKHLLEPQSFPATQLTLSY